MVRKLLVLDYEKSTYVRNDHKLLKNIPLSDHSPPFMLTLFVLIFCYCFIVYRYIIICAGTLTQPSSDGSCEFYLLFPSTQPTRGLVCCFSTAKAITFTSSQSGIAMKVCIYVTTFFCILNCFKYVLLLVVEIFYFR